jgi:hypothetical protein
MIEYSRDMEATRGRKMNGAQCKMAADVIVGITDSTTSPHISPRQTTLVKAHVTYREEVHIRRRGRINQLTLIRPRSIAARQVTPAPTVVARFQAA